jgi:hypothetical protein
MLKACKVNTATELSQILLLQELDLRGKKTAEEEKEQGFLTVAHSIEQLQQMHQLAPSVIVKDGEELAGYALVMAKACRDIIPVLIPMFSRFESLSYQGKPLGAYPFYIMGQVCVAKSYRGLGIFDMLYQKHKDLYQPSYSFVITEISTRNLRSLRAHERVGFKTLDVYQDDTDQWNVSLWDWAQGIPSSKFT